MWESLGEIEEPDQEGLAEQFNESGFEIYTSYALVEVNNAIRALLRNFKAKLVTSETLDLIRTRFFKVVELSDTLDKEARNRLLRRQEGELTNYSSAFISRSLKEQLKREDEVILF